ncbi:MAG: tRNA (adenosine(37)-N6)-dimethylallyltransferase MiaA [bacterium]|nr:tRNA (adenosine(37)-N6)-dimethylallyltransferase MiaA [bacterium]
MHNKIPILVLVGPTAVGKTDIGIEIAQALETEIISADSMQVYRYLNIGTAKPTLEQQRLVKHYMIDLVNPDEPYNAAIYSQQATQIAENLYNCQKIPLVVGGTGLYIRALIDGIFAQPKISESWRKQFRVDKEKKSNTELHAELRAVDELAADRIHPNDRRRILRALEVYHYFRIPISQFQQEQRQQGTRFIPLYFGLTMEMRRLYERIHQRIDKMINQGWVEEVQWLRAQGYSPQLLSMQGLGYRQINAFLDKKIHYEQMITLIQRDTRHYAKRQMTWFRANPRINWFVIDVEEKKNIINKIITITKNQFIA